MKKTFLLLCDENIETEKLHRLLQKSWKSELCPKVVGMNRRMWKWRVCKWWFQPDFVTDWIWQ